MRWCDAYGICKNTNKFGEDVVIDLVVSGDKSDNDEHVAAIRLDKEAVLNLISTLEYYIGEA
jgi:hypothetical protein